MTLEERDEKLKRLESLLENTPTEPTQLAIVLYEIWHDALWEITDDSFEEFLAAQFDMEKEDAFIAMKLAADAGAFPDADATAVQEAFEAL